MVLVLPGLLHHADLLPHQIVAEDDCQPVYTETAPQRDVILSRLFLKANEVEQLKRYAYSSSIVESRS
jgi:hypothetical protein